MNFFLVLPVALALAMDAFAVSVGLSVGLQVKTRSQSFRLAFCFGLFQFMMPVLGWLTARSILNHIQDFAHWVAFGLLFLVGSKMIYESFSSPDELHKGKTDPTKGFSLFMLSVATSIDALAVGMSFGVLDVAILYPACIIGFVAFFMTLFGTTVGRFLSRVVSKRAELLGGLILFFIGMKILIDHL